MLTSAETYTNDYKVLRMHSECTPDVVERHQSPMQCAALGNIVAAGMKGLYRGARLMIDVRRKLDQWQHRS
ncbi:hypothetical protein DENSPDRAFT_840392 [Dentipellis sp. KUC8613]|nr:hypothetical protein DENSPDRAFT_840392 [Dentipellis sp. KUC8613]